MHLYGQMPSPHWGLILVRMGGLEPGRNLHARFEILWYSSKRFAITLVVVLPNLRVPPHLIVRADVHGSSAAGATD